MTQKPDPSQAKSVSSVGDQVNKSMASSYNVQSNVVKSARPKSVAIAEVPENYGETEVLAEQGKRRIPLPSWHFLGILLIFFSGGVGFLATSVLLSFSGSNNCSALYVPLASATTRLYCAQLQAEEQTLEGYLKAIRMVNGFPQSHPLRPDIDQNIRAWIEDIIVLAEDKFQEGKKDEAIAILREIPEKAGFGEVIDEQIMAWDKLWLEGETILGELRDELKQGDLNEAMRAAVRLSYLENRYWATVKYDEALSEIQLARKENRELEVAYASQRRGGIENWLKAIEQASKISKDSYAYSQAQKLIDEAGDKIVRYIQGILEERRWRELISLCDRLPSSLNLDNMIVDWRILGQAGLTAEQGTLDSLETALVQIQSIQPASAVYDQAQELTKRWQQEIADVSLLEQGKNLAQGGMLADYEQAIAKLNLIPSGNPRYAESRELIRQWRNKIEIAEDSPTLEYAKDLAATGRLDRLAEAIDQAKTIKSGRALYSEAQSNIRKWQATIERAEDQPIFDRAVALGQQKQFSEAIATANQIASSRALYGEMQAKVRGWRQELTAISKLDSAYQAANGNSVGSWVTAINLALEIPSGATQLRAEGTQAANRWSFSILSTAQNQANYSLSQAIATARQIPRGTAAYEPAQVQIEAWRRLLIPAPNESNNEFNSL